MRKIAWITAVALGVGIFAAAQSGCRSSRAGIRMAPSEVVNKPAPIPSSTAPADFLATDFAELANWFEERFQVEYANMTPSLIFEQEPINQIKYELAAMPPNPPLFHLKSSNISRREILYQIAEFWNLTMSIEEVNGKPSVVKLRGPAPVKLSS